MRLPATITHFVQALAERVQNEPNLDDFLLWHAGTLEYWLHILASSVGERCGWASRREVRYFSRHYKGATTRSKLADGAIVLAEGLGLLLETKTISVSPDGRLGGGVRDVPHDLASMAAIDWPRSQNWVPQSDDWPWTDRYTDAQWWRRRKEIDELWGLHLILLHGHASLRTARDETLQQIGSGVAGLERRYREEPPRWLPLVREAITEPELEFEISGGRARGLLMTFGIQLAGE